MPNFIIQDNVMLNVVTMCILWAIESKLTQGTKVLFLKGMKDLVTQEKNIPNPDML